MKKMMIAFAAAILALTACEGDPFFGQGMVPSKPGVSDAEIVKVADAKYDPTYKELFLEWEKLDDSINSSFLGTEVTFTTLSGKVITTEIMRDKNFPQAYNRIVVNTASPSTVIYRSIWKNPEGQRLLSNPFKMKDMNIQNVAYGKDITFPTFKIPEYSMKNVAEGTPESDLYYQILGNPPYDYCLEHLKTVLGAMWFNENDPYVKLKHLQCQFKPSEHVAYVTWEGEKTIMCVSQEYMKQGLTANIDDIRFEIEGVAYHELTHTMQKSVSATSEFDRGCFVEGGADASRYICGGFSEEMRLSRAKAAVALPEDQTANPEKPGHPWLNQYSDSGLFMAWLRRYDGDFWRKFNYSTQILSNNDWSFENAVNLILSENSLVKEDIKKHDCEKDLLRGLWRTYKEDVLSENIN